MTMLLLRQWAGINVEQSRFRSDSYRKAVPNGRHNRYLRFCFLGLIFGLFGGNG